MRCSLYNVVAVKVSQEFVRNFINSVGYRLVIQFTVTYLSFFKFNLSTRVNENETRRRKKKCSVYILGIRKIEMLHVDAPFTNLFKKLCARNDSLD